MTQNKSRELDTKVMYLAILCYIASICLGGIKFLAVITPNINLTHIFGVNVWVILGALTVAWIVLIVWAIKVGK